MNYHDENIIANIRRHLNNALFLIHEEISNLTLTDNEIKQVKASFEEYFNAIENDLVVYDVIHKISVHESEVNEGD